MILYFEDPYRTNDSQLAQGPREKWMDEIFYRMWTREGFQFVCCPLYGLRRVKGLRALSLTETWIPTRTPIWTPIRTLRQAL